MKNVFWLIDQKIAGRAGPDLTPWDIAELRAGGIGAVLSVNSGIACDPEEFAQHEITYSCIKMPANEPPKPPDDDACFAALPRTYAFIEEQLSAQRSVLIHCTLGKDRTGMAMAYYLMRSQALDPDNALAQVRSVRPVALSANGWEAMGRRVLERLHNEPG